MTEKTLLAVAVQCKQLYEGILMGEVRTPNNVNVGLEKIHRANAEFQKVDFENRTKAAGECGGCGE